MIEIDAESASAWLKAGDIILLDVREKDEQELEGIPGATPMPLSKFDAGKVAEMANKKIVVICFSGRRSKDAAERLIVHGIAEVYSVKDGLLAWKAAGLDVVN